MRQNCQMAGERVRRNAQFARQIPGGDAAWLLPHQEPNGRKAGRLRQGGEGLNRII